MSKLNYIPFNKAFNNVPIGKHKIQENSYLQKGDFKIVDQGKSLIAGYSNEREFLKTDFPYILFGDHTKVIKYIDFPFIAGADGVRLYKASENFEPKFLYHYLRSINLPSDSYGRHSKYLEEILVPELNISIQQEIVILLDNQLSEIEKAREATEIINQDIKRLKYLALDDFLSEFNETEKFKLGAKAETTSGSTPSRGQKDYWQPAEIPWIKTGEIAFTPIAKSEEYVSAKALKECSLKLLPENSVLIAMYGQGKTRGQSAILKVPATINQACFAILPNETWDPEFLQLWLMYSYQDMRNMSENRGGNQANLNGDLLNSFEVPAPLLEVQQEVVIKINEALKELETMKASWINTAEEIKILPNRLLAQAFNEIEND
ncbi:MAG: restriction endonuclease subunit S [Bacteroidales bacterium]|nr:restriction endonuclease subunit S [Bacteroidales bacterium]